MMPSEATKLIITARQIDRFVSPPDDLVVNVWCQRLNAEQISYQYAYEALLGTSESTITLQWLIDEVKINTRRTPAAIAEDVRSARARRLVPRDWSERDAVPADVREKLAELRDESRSVAQQALGTA